MPRLVLMCGLAGAGKSTYARSLQEDGWTRVSIDADAWELGFTEAAGPDECDVTVLRVER